MEKLKKYCYEYITEKYGKDYIKTSRITKNGLFLYGKNKKYTFISKYDKENKEYINDLLEIFTNEQIIGDYENNKYLIVLENNKNFVLASCPTLELAKQYKKEFEENDKKLQKYYNWSKLPKYEIKEEIKNEK